MKKVNLIFFIPFIFSIIAITILSLITNELIISGVIIINTLLFFISALILNKGYLFGNLIGIIPAIICSYLGMQERGQIVSEIVFAIPIYVFYIICFLYMIIDKKRNKNKKKWCNFIMNKMKGVNYK